MQVSREETGTSPVRPGESSERNAEPLLQRGAAAEGAAGEDSSRNHRGAERTGSPTFQNPLHLTFVPSPENPFAGHRHPTVPHAAIVRPFSFPYVFHLAVDKGRRSPPLPSAPPPFSSEASSASSFQNAPFALRPPPPGGESDGPAELLSSGPGASAAFPETDALGKRFPESASDLAEAQERKTCTRKCAFFLWVTEPGGAGGPALPDGDLSRHWQTLSKRLARAAWEDLYETVVVYAPLFQVELLPSPSNMGFREYAGWLAAQLNAFLPETLGAAVEGEGEREEGASDARAVTTGCGLWDFFVEGWGAGANAARLLWLRSGRLWLGSSPGKAGSRADAFQNARRLQQLVLSLQKQGRLRLRSVAFHSAPLAGLGGVGSTHAFSRDTWGSVSLLAPLLPARLWRAALGSVDAKELLRLDRDRLLCRLAQEEKRNYVEGVYGGGSLLAAFDVVLYFGYSDAGAGISPNTQLGLPDALVVSLESVARALAARQEMLNRFFFVDAKDSCANQTRADRPVKLCMGSESVRTLLLDDEACSRYQGTSLQLLTLAFLATHVPTQTPKPLFPHRYLAGRGGWVLERVHWLRRFWGARPQLNALAARRLLTQPVVRLLQMQNKQKEPFDGDHNSVMHLFWFGRTIAEEAQPKRSEGSAANRNGA